jgi:sulfur-carrier protein
MRPPDPPGSKLRVRIPGLLRSYTAGVEQVAIDVAPAADGAPARLADGIGALDARYPGLAFRIVDERGSIRPHIRLFVDGAQARDLAAPLPREAELMIVGALSGG